MTHYTGLCYVSCVLLLSLLLRNTMPESLLTIHDLTITAQDFSREKIIVSKVNLDIPSLNIFALVGGSGSGKTTLGLSVLRLLPLGLTLRTGEIKFNGVDVLTLSDERMRRLRGKEIGMVFQEPLDAFNPVFPIGDQIQEVLKEHLDLNRGQRQKRILELLDLVGIPDPRRVAQAYPHQLSGGMRQRSMIAQAIAAHPKLIIADEPTSNLDVTLQVRIMELFRTLKKEFSLSILLITHDLGMVTHLADSVAVISRGEIVETGLTREILAAPKQNYTRQLMNAFSV